MAKKQTFGDKLNKAGDTGQKKYVKVIRSLRTKGNNSLKFNELMLAVSGDKDPAAAVKEFFNK
tara:strand:- start:387 stop:575 length:189 start_codon:yes stop_codon:yes gene_type:complete